MRSTPVLTGEPPIFDAAFRRSLRELFAWRRDVRHFLARPIAPELLDLAALAPSVGLSQPWRFVTVDDPARRAAVRAAFEDANRAALASQPATRASYYARLKLVALDEAPVHLAAMAVADPEQGHGLGRMTMAETTGYSAAMAIHTLWLAAHAAGLGLGWVSILDQDRVHAVLDVPADRRLVGYLCLGCLRKRPPCPNWNVPAGRHAGHPSRRCGASPARSMGVSSASVVESEER